ncbi:hypothetical protein F4802DRAFT_551339 [Xylaria palmicola]|nr:hypothetical protein F4802DRAFT_551339 [Xylaria palmicola]
MVTLRSRRFLRCFYCGKKSNIQFDAQRSFDCASCDATNWLDLNGDIADPPAEADLAHSNVQYAVPRPANARSPSPLPADSGGDAIFCATCLRNQHMLSSSLAQFEWPEDPTSAENIERERKYWALKKTLEQRYPQACQHCLPKVKARLAQASYTAQTDHLRRMINRTRSNRVAVKRRSPLDVVDFIGKLSWYAGFALQAVWHVTVVCLLATETYASTQDDRWIPVVLGAVHRMSALMLPYSDRLMHLALHFGIWSFPWNPRFKQFIRGFTPHIIGFKQWYTYQVLVLLVRFVAVFIAQFSKSYRLPATTQLSAQFVISLFMIYLYLTAKKAIHTDPTPLFRQAADLTAGLRVESDFRSATKDPDDLGSVLDGILSSPPGRQNPGTGASLGQSTSVMAASNTQIHGLEASNGQTTPISGMVQGTMQIPQDGSPLTHYGSDEMDWSPSASQHRAFSSYNPYKVKNTNPRFSDIPTEPKPGPLWFKVPPAPTNPAQRSRNPPMRPIIRESPKEKKETFFQSIGQRPIDFGSRYRDTSNDLNLAAPRFFAPEPQDDPRDGLSNMFATSFSLSPSPEEPGERDMRRNGKVHAEGPDTIPNRTATRFAELMALLAALGSWVFVLDPEKPYGPTVALASIVVCLLTSIRLAADLEVDHQIRGGTRPSAFTRLWANLALAQVIAVILLMWTVWSGSASPVPSAMFGNTMFGFVITHHIWHIFA